VTKLECKETHEGTDIQLFFVESLRVPISEIFLKTENLNLPQMGFLKNPQGSLAEFLRVSFLNSFSKLNYKLKIK